MHKAYMKLSLWNEDIKKSIWFYIANFWFLFDIDKSIKFDDCNQIVSLRRNSVFYVCLFSPNFQHRFCVYNLITTFVVM